MALIERDLTSPNFDTSTVETLWDLDTVDDAVEVLGVDWAPNYLAYREPSTRDLMVGKVDAIAHVLGYQAEDNEVIASKAFINDVYDTWESQETLDGYGSFVFMVPTRAIRGNGFAPEFKPFIPLIDKLGPNTAQLLLVGLPPFVVDSYQADGDGKRGAMVFAPGFYDILNDVPLEEAGQTFNTIMDDAVTFTRDKLNARSVGLGATLPAVTDFGRSINVPGVDTTTGHGGTVHLINETVASALKSGRIDEIKGIGILGLGSIGASIATVLAVNNPEIPINIYDTNPKKVARTLETLQGLNGLRHAGVTVADSDVDLVGNRASNVIVSAVTQPIDLKSTHINMEGKLLVDDSQPTAFDPKQAEQLGALLTWPIGEDTTHGGSLTRVSFDYGDLGPSKDNEIWGCELEAKVASDSPSLALKGPVTPETSLRMSHFIVANNIAKAARLQSFGRYV